MKFYKYAFGPAKKGGGEVYPHQPLLRRFVCSRSNLRAARMRKELKVTQGSLLERVLMEEE